MANSLMPYFPIGMRPDEVDSTMSVIFAPTYSTTAVPSHTETTKLPEQHFKDDTIAGLYSYNYRDSVACLGIGRYVLDGVLVRKKPHYIKEEFDREHWKRLHIHNGTEPLSHDDVLMNVSHDVLRIEHEDRREVTRGAPLM